MSDSILQGQVCPAVISIEIEVPLALSRIHAGFPSPAEDYAESALDIGRLLVKDPKTTFFMKVVGDSMEGLRIHEGDILVIDRAAPIVNHCIVVARLGDEFCVKQLRMKDGQMWLYSTSDKYKPIPIGPDSDIEIWGRVLHKVTSFTGKL